MPLRSLNPWILKGLPRVHLWIFSRKRIGWQKVRFGYRKRCNLSDHPGSVHQIRSKDNHYP